MAGIELSKELYENLSSLYNRTFDNGRIAAWHAKLELLISSYLACYPSAGQMNGCDIFCTVRIMSPLNHPTQAWAALGHSP
jgi:hypothetical protein